MSGAIKVYSDAAQAVRANGLMRATGWEIPGGSSTGASGGAALKVGGGYASFPVRKIGAKSGFLLQGGYAEAGVGLGVEVDAKVFGKAAERLWSILGSGSSDFGAMPSGSLGPLYFGPSCSQAGLVYGDFERSTWMYQNLAATVGGIAGDIGLLMLISPALFAKALAAQPALVPAAVKTYAALIIACKAWCLYGGTSITFGVSVGAGARVVQIVSISPEQM
jgi:hypothetical protein